MTIWAQMMPKFLSIASSYPYVMHALLSFSANHLAWVHRSSETRNLHIQHGSIALRGLHEAIGSFSRANADAVLAASLLMLWQATDLRSWSSLRAGTRSVLMAMQSWKHESLFANDIAEEELVAGSLLSYSTKPLANPSDRVSILQNIMQALQRVQLALVGHEQELHWLNQLFIYVQRLQSLNPAQTAEEQFSQLYYLRKWLFWVPISLLQRNAGQGPAMLTLAHFYATALALEPLFPELGSSFCSEMALTPLEAILNVTDAMQSEQTTQPRSTDIAVFLQFPLQMALSYRSRALQAQQMGVNQEPALVGQETWGYATMGSISPAFTPPSLHYGTSQPASTAQSPFLEVPSTYQGLNYGTQGWGVPSPGLPAQTYGNQDEHIYEYMSSTGNSRSGFVAPVPIWT
ncbi:hypothetical protein LTR37_000394 [Vermiconidia calcicola]|uniref:Uncharacterized protein n=1 Tax=Vermiconidia calcicola TaxID=1690605 RepID=A0ACC3NYC6_9PEZI|nr:hypothetical protein LTR37_000394 [Vermiconidia calcicola]